MGSTPGTTKAKPAGPLTTLCQALPGPSEASGSRPSSRCILAPGHSKGYTGGHHPSKYRRGPTPMRPPSLPCGPSATLRIWSTSLHNPSRPPQLVNWWRSPYWAQLYRVKLNNEAMAKQYNAWKKGLFLFSTTPSRLDNNNGRELTNVNVAVNECPFLVLRIRRPAVRLGCYWQSGAGGCSCLVVDACRHFIVRAMCDYY